MTTKLFQVLEAELRVFPSAVCGVIEAFAFEAWPQDPWPAVGKFAYMSPLLPYREDLDTRCASWRNKANLPVPNKNLEARLDAFMSTDFERWPKRQMRKKMLAKGVLETILEGPPVSCCNQIYNESMRLVQRYFAEYEYGPDAFLNKAAEHPKRHLDFTMDVLREATTFGPVIDGVITYKKRRR
jgi:hypothetical protein